MIYRRAKLKDKIYGEMVWHDTEEGENNWFAKVKDDEKGFDLDLLIEVPSQADILAVSLTHPIYRKIISELDSIRHEMIKDILENLSHLFRNKHQKRHFADYVSKNLVLYSLTFYYDLSSEISFVKKYDEDEYPDEQFYAALDKDGNFLEAGIRES